MCLMVISVPAMAQTQDTGSLVFKVDGGVVHQSDTDLKDGGGSFAVDRWFVSGGIDYVWDQRTSLGFSIGGGKSNYEFGDLTGLAS